MRKIKVTHDEITLTDNVEIVYEKRITPFGNGAKVDAPKRYIGNRVYVIILKGR
jgi:putative transposon-encoded protein